MKLNKVFDYINKPKASVIIVHGILEHQGRYSHVAEFLNNSGYDVIRYDQRGHGKSEGKPGALNSWHDLIDDLHHIVLEERSRSNNKIFLLGHSMGGLVVNLYAAKYGDIDGVISIGAATNTPEDAKILKYTGFWYLRWVKKSANRLDNHLSRDPKVLDKKKLDPLMLSHMYVSLIGEMFIKGIKYLKNNTSNLTQPFYYLHGGADAIVNADFSKHMYEVIPSNNKTLKIYEGAYHEILNETNKAEVLTDIVNWLNQQ